MNDPASPLQALHAAFCRITQADEKVVQYRLFERDWYEFNSMGFTLADLELVLAHIARQNSRQTNPDFRRKLSIRSIISDLPRFAEDLMDARRRQAQKATPKEKALGELRGFIPERGGNNLKSLGELLKQGGLQ